MTLALMDRYKLSSGFLHILASFRARYLPSEESFSGAPRSISGANTSGMYRISLARHCTDGFQRTWLGLQVL
jgi:hypothetical protein